MHLIAGHSLDGVLGGLYADGVELQSASYVRAGEESVPLDGTQIIPWRSIIWVQEAGVGVGPSSENA